MVNNPTTTNADMDLKINITTLVTGVKMRGCFFVKGKYVKDI